MTNDFERYSVIHEKNKREIVLLRGKGCFWKRCAFCDYHLDACEDEMENFALNREVLAQVTGCYEKLEVINSGSFPELDSATVGEILRVCKKKGIRTVHVESHYHYRDRMPRFRELFAVHGITLKIKTGIETFDEKVREEYLKKGVPDLPPVELAKGFDEVCLLFGIAPQTLASMEQDVETGLQYFQRVCINIMCENTTKIQPDAHVIEEFCEHLLPKYADNPRIDILMENVDFGVGGKK